MSLLTPENYLDLVQRTFVDCGITDDPPTTTLNPTGQVQAICNLVNQQWLEIQSKHDDWNFMRVSPGVSFVTVAGQQLYTPTQAGITRGVVSSWRRGTFRVYNTAAGFPSEMEMSYWDYDDWRDLYQFSSQRTAQQIPLNFTITPNNSIGLQCPLAGYTITGDYHSAPLPFAADADVPSIPPQFIMLIVYKTMMVYGLTESAPEVYGQGKLLYDPLMSKLENQRLKEIRTAGALA
jgi:hypothetical protein